jgi:hypothetical protein
MREYLTKFKNDFNGVFVNTLNYHQIKKNVNIPISQKNKPFSLRYRFAAILLFILILGGVFLMVATNRIIYRDGNDTTINYANVEETVVWADYIFIGKVDKKLYTKQFDGTGYHMPYTYYSLSNIKYLKGKGEETEKIVFFGGYDFLNNLIVFVENDVLPDPGEYYLFTVRRVNSSNTDRRIEANSLNVHNKEQAHLLSGYIPTKSIQEQSLSNQKIINPYLNALALKE